MWKNVQHVESMKQRNNLSPQQNSNPVGDSEILLVPRLQNILQSDLSYLFTKLKVYHLSLNKDVLSSLIQNLLFLQTGRKSAGKNFLY